MPVDPSVLQIRLMFQAMNRYRDPDIYPEPGSLSKELSSLIDTSLGDYSFNVAPGLVRKFATASVEMWHRAIHSFLISASLTNVSPVWSSVSGYYSSHYSMRAFSHLLGYFQLYKIKRVVQLDLSGAGYSCKVSKKNASEREHRVSWKLVKAYHVFNSDPFFTINDENMLQSDGGHRNKANYFDHIGIFPVFNPLNEQYLKRRVQQISSIQLSTAPIPNVESFPDIENVQLIAYHRLIRYRMFLDEILGGTNRYWKVHRNPSWCPTYFDFQITQPEYSQIYQGLV